MTNNEIRYNEGGHPIKQCPECQQDININSFVNDLCISCHDMNQIKVFEVTEGDYNDVFSRTIIKATGKQIDKYCLNQFADDDNIEDLPSNIGYCIYFDPDPEIDEEDQEIRIEYYIEAEELEDYNINQYGEIEIDLTSEDSV